MPESDLPFEILSRIASYVFNDGKLACMMTCKRWKIPYQESVWKTLQIDFMEELEEICTTAKNSTSRFLPYDLTTEIIHIYKLFSINKLQKLQVFQTFRNLKHLDIKVICFDPADADFTRYVSGLSSLVSLVLQPTQTTQRMFIPLILEILGHMPNLQKLHIRPAFLVPPIPQTIPVPGVATLNLAIVGWDPIWLYYFSFKYPKIRSLEWTNCSSEDEEAATEYTVEKKELLRSITKAFTCLETIDLYSQLYMEWEHAIFSEVLCRLHAPIKKLIYRSLGANSTENFWERIIQQFAQSFS
ncbi:hypothetical protein J3Q64DRAFT_1835946 [Phycomyces blakesleeanus]|uniref:F-box domain-containing protein n=2 Tax=Phycomyces blakesleeanus TaxID=4837 RepID=A0A167MD71_PHYB8|nr:hypothetical protein PHYBLDRAFT_169641 [Phycomyces blakesleeanus NRRL 1555(-)]OAD72514.1 hypothetical protein PHYBLDRAFT_169641 [Phycomyces blakesleeanus NRRL 1555(-)]|eukprot:XP_018290554.1 hypothetical protein PHYBLDRAFT_169641 [Phycomyces blakesleeanus NRRL 1555(-)]